ncbi:MAG: response regulator [Actinobacteria bacterium]|nr:response regulator [Actinomycetota bacterium]
MALNVLVVDDSDVIRNMIIKTLRLADIPVGATFEAGNGKEALDIVDANWIDLVLADINMPIMDGVEMLRRLRSDHRHAELPVIVVTTEGSSERIAELQDADVSAYVRKPFTPEMIRRVVDDVTSTISAGETATEELMAAFAEVLERFVMMDGIPAVGDLPPLGQGDLLQASMTFRGGVDGTITVAAPLEACVEMAANAIGTDPDGSVGTGKACDALGEVLNITCGNLVLALEPTRQTELTPPVVLGMDLPEWEYLASAASTAGFDVEGLPVLVSCLIRPRR